MYRKRHQKRGGWPEFLDQALEQAKEKASNPRKKKACYACAQRLTA
jgi:hypothetical protein